jgi:hypothetical protein
LGKIVTIYLSDDEAGDLKEFCDENRCTQYSALKTAVKQLLSKPILLEVNTLEDLLMEPQEVIEEIEENSTGDDEIEDDVLQDDEDAEPVSNYENTLRNYLRRLKE